MKNELIHESSPYLLQHAGNPVHWQPWGVQALQLAKELNRPLLVSIGYSACHWCHVMERESFEDEATAVIMNEHFINVKIDREERPDLDHIYMDAVQAMTGSGGWPLNVFLTPEGKPFYGGTYFPPVKAFNRASWKDVLLSIHDAWLNRKSEMEQQAETLIAHLQKSNNFGQVKNAVQIENGKPVFTKEDCIQITKNLMLTADKTEGGFGKAPKFPQTFSINCLLQSAYFLEDANAFQHAELSLNKMLNGGIYDQLAGGLCRYSTDNEWLTPHFEKMLYDNALFIIALSNAFLLTKKEVYKKAIEQTCDFIFSEMKNKTGGYFAALDADSEGVEGKFYVWDKNETDTILGENAALFNSFYDITAQGNWEGKNILRILQPLPEIARKYTLTESEAEKILNTCRKKLLTERNKRTRPATDDKILLGWNALLITAFCKAFAGVQNEKYKSAAIELFNFTEKAFQGKNGSYFHTYKNGDAKYPAFSDDYAYLTEACIHLQEITADESYLRKAKILTEYVLENFPDPESDFFFFTEKNQEDVIVRKVELYDGAVPSANAVMTNNLLYLSLIFDERDWHSRALKQLASLKTIITSHPASFGIWAASAMNVAAGINEIAIVGSDMMPLLRKTLHRYIPNKIMQATTGNSDMALLREKHNFNKTSIYLCRDFKCSDPITDISELDKHLKFNLFLT